MPHFPTDPVNGKSPTIKKVPFDESVLWKNFCHLVRYETIVARNLMEGLRGVALSNKEGYVESVMYNSELMIEVFEGSQQAISEYFYLRELQKGNKRPAIYKLS